MQSSTDLFLQCSSRSLINVCQDLSLLRASKAGGHSIRQTVRTSRDSLATVRSSISTWSCLCNNHLTMHQSVTSMQQQTLITMLFKNTLNAFDQNFISSIFSKYDIMHVQVRIIPFLNCFIALVNFVYTLSIGNLPSLELCGFPHQWRALDGENYCLKPRLFSVWPLSQTCQAQTWPPARITNMQQLLLNTSHEGSKKVLVRNYYFKYHFPM